jgi:hypothetical protein
VNKLFKNSEISLKVSTPRQTPQNYSRLPQSNSLTTKSTQKNIFLTSSQTASKKSQFSLIAHVIVVIRQHEALAAHFCHKICLLRHSRVRLSAAKFLVQLQGEKLRNHVEGESKHN